MLVATDFSVALCGHVARLRSTVVADVRRHVHLKRKWSLELSPGNDRSPRTRPFATSAPRISIRAGRVAASSSAGGRASCTGRATIPTRRPSVRTVARSFVRSLAMINAISNYDLFAPSVVDPSPSLASNCHRRPPRHETLRINQRRLLD